MTLKLPLNLHLALQSGLWLVALAWTVQTVAAYFGLPRVPDLLLPEHNRTPAGEPSIAVIVPARNEGRDIRACLESLLAQDYPRLRIVAIDDRSTDDTGRIMQSLAAAYPDKLQVLTLRELPAGWLGKTHAMSVAAAQTETDFLLFTDADILFHPSAIRFALANAVTTGAQHFVLVPTTIIRRWDEAALLSFLQTVALWGVRYWKVADPRARDTFGVGAFNLISRTAYERIGGFAAFRMEIVEDLGLARRVKQAGMAQRVAFGRDLVRVHWASGVSGLIDVLTKNIFSAFNFRVPLVLLTCSWLTAFAILPFCGLFVPWLRLPSALSVAAIACSYTLVARKSGLSPWNALLAPLAAAVTIYALLRSTLITLLQGGVIWRGTFYSLAELRRNMAPLLPRRPRHASNRS